MEAKDKKLPRINVFQKENMIIRLTLKDATMTAIDVSTATLQLTVKEKLDSTIYNITVADTSFDKALGAQGIVTFPLTATDLNLSGEYIALLKITFTTGGIKKTCFKLVVEPSEE